MDKPNFDLSMEKELEVAKVMGLARHASREQLLTLLEQTLILYKGTQQCISDIEKKRGSP